MLTSSSPPLSAADYDAIASAVMETSRGRWFLAEYARRNRHADTDMLLTALQRLEKVVQTESVSSVDRMRAGLIDMASAISKAKSDIAALRPEDQQGRIEEATEELDSVVNATEKATSEILAAAEQVQETAWILREQGANPEQCDSLDGLATDVYTACSFQDLTGQRTRKVINLLRYLEGRIDAMIDLWGGRQPAPAALEPESRATGDQTLLNGPAKPGEGLDQSGIDDMMFDSPAAPDSPAMLDSPATFDAIETLDSVEMLDSPAAVDPAETLGPAETFDFPETFDSPETESVATEPSPPLQPTATLAASAESEPDFDAPRDPLAPLKAMSEDERVALFT